MSLAEMIDRDALYNEGLITLRYLHPRCAICDRERHQSERKFLEMHGGICHECISRREGNSDG